MTDNGRVRLQKREDGVAFVTFDRPEARNAMTLQMYEELGQICDQLAADSDLRVVVFRGAGGKSFVAGSDISLFTAFKTPEDGIAYEHKMDAYFEKLLAIPVPTVAAIEGWAVGGGMSIAACCDLRIADKGARFGVPIARTVGNCLSMQTYNRLLQGFGEARTKRMLLLAEFIDAEEAHNAGFLARLVEIDEMDATVEAVVERLLANAPLTLKVSKAALARISQRDLDPADDLIALCYGSSDFKQGVNAFTTKTKPTWKGR